MRRLAGPIAAFALGLAVIAPLPGCLLTGTKVFAHEAGDLAHVFAFSSGRTMHLRENTTYEKHRDDIKRIEQIGLTMSIVNRTIAAARLSIWFSDRDDLSDPGEIRNGARLLLPILDVPATATRAFTYEESVAGLTDFEAMAALVEAGELTMYVVGDGLFNIVLEDITLVVTMTVGL